MDSRAGWKPRRPEEAETESEQGEESQKRVGENVWKQRARDKKNWILLGRILFLTASYWRNAAEAAARKDPFCDVIEGVIDVSFAEKRSLGCELVIRKHGLYGVQ